ncbi:MAG TPA: hypothetical protein VGE52_22235, partial [Pirellulales bacterium]
MARSWSSFRWASIRDVSLALVLTAALSGCTQKATVGPTVSKSSSTQSVEANSLLNLGMVAVQNPEDRNLVLQEKTPEQLQAEMLLEVLRAYPAEAARAANQADGEGGAEGSPIKYDYRVRSGSLSFEQNPDGTMGVRLDGVEKRQPTLVFNNPDTFHDAIDHLNQWLGAQTTPPPPWSPDPLIKSLPETLRNAGVLYGVINDLPKLKFNRESEFRATHDGWFLQEVVWFRDVSHRVTSGTADPLDQAKQLFDWTTRSIQRLAGPAIPLKEINGREYVNAVPMLPWEVLLKGEGHIEHRAWVFTLLARQQGLNVVLLPMPSGDAAARDSLWAAGLLHDKQLYLFDLELGAPIPGPNGQGVATLAQAAADPAILQAMDLPERPYPVKSTDLVKLTAFIEASPTYLSRRMSVLQSALAGNNQLVLTVNPSRLADELGDVNEIETVRLWELPYRNINTLVGASPIVADLVPAYRTALLSFYTPQPHVQAVRSDMWCARVADLKGKYLADAATAGDPDVTAVSADRQAAIPMYLRVRKESLAVEQAMRDPRTPRNLLQFYHEVGPFTHRAAQDASLFLGMIAYERAAADPAQKNLLNTAANFFSRDVLGDP